jgi:hypothetical protein
MPVSFACPHCSRPLSDPNELNCQEFPCPLCGKSLTALIPTSTANPTPSEAFAFDDPAVMPSEPRYESRSASDIYERVSELLPEWQSAWHGLNLACLATKLFILAYVLRTIGYSITPLKSVEDYFLPLVIAVLVLSFSLLLIMLIHLWGQFMCRALPDNYGSWTARRSCYVGMVVPLLIGPIFTLMAINTFVPDFARPIVAILGVLFIFTLPVFVLGWFWYWVGFLRKLGAGLNSYELVGNARKFMGWFWLTFWANSIFTIVVAGSQGRMQVITSSCLGFGVGILTTLMLINYNRLLWTARDVLARRGMVIT